MNIKSILLAIIFLTTCVHGEEILIYKGKDTITQFQGQGLKKIDLNRLGQQFELPLPKGIPVIDEARLPAIYNTKTKIFVYSDELTTNTVAEVFDNKLKQRSPAMHREKDTWPQDELQNAAARANSANSVPALRAEVARLAELVEYLVERVELLED